MRITNEKICFMMGMATMGLILGLIDLIAESFK